MKFVIFIISFVSVVFANGDILFGLKYGMTPAQVQAKGFKLKKIEPGVYGFKERMTSYSIIDTVKCDSLKGDAGLGFIGDTFLVKISFSSDYIYDDDHGTKGKEIFNNFVSMFSKDHAVSKMKLEVKNENDFYGCIDEDPKCRWEAKFKSDNEKVEMMMLGISKGIGALSLDFFAEPQHDDYLKEGDKILEQKFKEWKNEK